MKEQKETASILSLGSSPNRKQRILWRNMEGDAFRDDPNYMPSLTIFRKGRDAEFFLLYHNGEVVGRAAASIDKRWIEEKGENIGFIDDFVISPGHEHLADMLIERCLSVLREKGAEGVVVRSHGFPALAAQELEDMPPWSLPCNPPQYIDLFEKKGFVKYKEWANFRFTLPKVIPEDSIIKGRKLVDSLQAKVEQLNIRSQRQVREYAQTLYDILIDHYGYTPSIFFTGSSSWIKHFLFIILCKLARFRIYVGQDESGKIFGFFSFSPNYNITLKPFTELLGRSNPLLVPLLILKFFLLSIPRSFISLHRTKRAEIGALGITEEMRGIGLVSLMDYMLKLMKDEGYVELDTGAILMENRVVVKMVQHVQKRYGMRMEHMKYYTLRYTF